MEEDERILKLYPPSVWDHCTARCRLPLKLLSRKNIGVNHWVEVVTNEQTFYCRAWPLSSSASANESDYCQIDRLIRKPVRERGVEGFEGKLDAGQCVITTLPARPPIAKSITIKASVINAESEMEALGFRYETASPTVKRQALRGMLSGLLISTGCVVGDNIPGHSLRVEIIAIEPPTCGAALVTSITRVLFETDTRTSSGTSTQGAIDTMDTLTSSMNRLALSTKTGLSERIPGLEKAYQCLLEIVMYPLMFPAMISKLGVEPPKGVLLHGPPGVGKTLLVSTIARACKASMVTVHGPEIFGAYLGESEERLRAKFKEAQVRATESTPCILFIDEIDAITPHRESTQSHGNRVVAQLLTLMDGMASRGRLVVVGATNRPNAIDPALRRPGRFDREVAIEVPSEEARLAILRSLTREIPLGPDVDLNEIAAATNGYVGADLAALCREAALDAAQRMSKPPYPDHVSWASFQKALAIVGTPSTQRGATTNVERLKWDDVGGLESVKLQLRQAVEWPLMYRDTYKGLGLKPPRGVLLYGPPGCSKTTLVKVIAATSGATFLSLNGASLYSPFVGDSEASIRAAFHRARAGAPSVIFLDEVDAIVGKRELAGSGGGGGGKGDTVQERVLSTLLNEMDGVELAKDVLVVGATNRPDMIDAALMRPGRFDKVIYVPPPDAQARRQILGIYTKSMSLAPDVDLESLAGAATERHTGADLKAICREAAMEALRGMRDANVVGLDDFHAALAVVQPTLSDEMLGQYEAFSQRFGKGVSK